MVSSAISQALLNRRLFTHSLSAIAFPVSSLPNQQILQRSGSASHARAIEQRPASFAHSHHNSTKAHINSQSVRSFVLSQRSNVRSAVRRQQQQPRPRLVIFDKDGTLICFHSLWVPWIRSFAANLEETARVSITSKVFQVLGFCPILKKVRRGLLAEGTLGQIRERIALLLVQNGIELKKAETIVEKAINAAIPLTDRTVRQIVHLERLFGELKQRGIKIAICTADSRVGTLGTLSRLGVDGLVDLVVCGDDEGSMPKPHPNNALFICRQLGVDPQDTMVIGDTPADLGMGRSAKLGFTVGVLSGIGDQKELASDADHLVENVGELIPLIG